MYLTWIDKVQAYSTTKMLIKYILNYYPGKWWQTAPFLVLLLLSIPSAFAQNHPPVIINQTQQMQLIGQQVYWLEDTTANLDIADVLTAKTQQKFKRHTQDIFNKPPTKSTLWFKFVVHNKTGKELWLEIGDGFSFYLDFYAPNAQRTYDKPIKLGGIRSQQNKEILSHFYYVPLSKDDTVKTYYLRKAGDFIHYHTFQAGTRFAVSQHIRPYEYTLAGFVAIMLAMAMYNLFLLYATRDKIYLVYVAFLLSTLVVVPFNNGYPLFYGTFWWKYFYVWHDASFLFISLFATYYLNLPKFAPRLNRWIWILTLVVVVVVPVLSILEYPGLVHIIEPAQVIILLYFFLIFSTSIYVWRKGHSNARFYVLGWFFTIASIFIHLFALQGILPGHHLFHNSPYIGVSCEALLFALALGDRLNSLKKEKDLVRAENLRIIEEQNDILAQKVEEKTSALQTAYEEVQTNNEELKITQEVVASHNKLLEERNEELSLYRNRIGQSFRAAQMIQTSLLPSVKQMEAAFAECFVLNMPKDVVSGDFYWLHTHHDTTVLVVADCTGHGVPGAFMTFIGSNLLDKIVRLRKIISPDEILSFMNKEIVQVLNQKETKHYEGGMDAVVVTFRKAGEAGEDTQVIFAGAKRELWYMKPDSELMQEIKGTRKSIGGFQPKEKKPFRKHVFSLPPGSQLYFGSDGFSDQNDKHRRKFGSARLKGLLQKNAHLSLAAQRDELVSDLEKHMEEVEQRDDILWLGVKV